MKIILIAIGALALSVAFQAAIITLAWNFVMPSVFDVGQVSIWQAFGFLFIAKILFQPEISTSNKQ